MDDEPQPTRRAPSSRKLAALALLLALLQLGLAFQAELYASNSTCPAATKGSACAPLLRPRVAAVGPVSASQIGLVGAAFAVGLCALLAMGKAPPGLVRGGPAVLAAGAGFAIGLQALPFGLGASSCPLCLKIVVVVNLVAVLAVLAARKPAGVTTAGVAFAVALLVAAPTAFLRGQAIAAEDVVRRAAVEAVGDRSAGPQLVMATRPGCPYCEALLLDVLGDPTVLELLRNTRGVVQVREFMPRVKKLMEVPGVPALLLVSADGKLIGKPLIGLEPVETVRRWLSAGLSDTR